MEALKRIVVPARAGLAVELADGAAVKLVNTYGTQVVDTWAFVPPDLGEHLSMEHTRAAIRRLVPRVGDALYSNERRPLLTLDEDTSPGVHDTLMAACDPARYRQLGHDGPHANCRDNMLAALAELGYGPRPVPAPLNLFMRVPWSPEGALEFAAPVSRPGDSVTLRAARPVVVVFSACPQDLTPVNGDRHAPREVQVELLPA